MYVFETMKTMYVHSQRLHAPILPLQTKKEKTSCLVSRVINGPPPVSDKPKSQTEQ